MRQHGPILLMIAGLYLTLVAIFWQDYRTNIICEAAFLAQHGSDTK